ncbi:MAG: hypothetical protein P8J86_08265 [Phycisphaerales bacterium]|nr:hypothetical protein [Phycisphaerales bacterium]
MNTHQIHEQRIEALERQLIQSRRQHRLLIGLGGMALVGMATMAATMPRNADVIQAHRLEILDQNGGLLAAIGTDKNGGRLDLWNSSGGNVLRASVNGHGGDLAIWNNLGGTAMGAYTTESGATLGLWNGQDQRAITLASTESNASISANVGGHSAELSASDHLAMTSIANPGGARAMLGASGALNSVDMTLQGPGGTTVSMSAAHDQGTISLGPSRLSPAAALISENGTARFETRHEDGQITTMLGHETDGGILTLNHTDGQHLTGMATAEGGQLQLGASDNSAAVALIGAPSGGRIDLTNSQGDTVSSLGVDDTQGGLLEIRNQGQKIAAAISTAKDAGAIALMDKRGQRAFAIGVGPAGGIMNLINERGVPVVLLGQSPNNQGGAIIVNNQGGNQVVSVTCDSDDAGAIRVMDAEAKKYNTVLPRSRPGMSGQ